MIGDLINAGANLISGVFNRNAQSDYNDQQAAQAAQNRDLQIKFAQEGIRWKVQDAEAAGIHPLYALGANTVSYSPVALGGTPETGLASGLAASSQDISRAIHSTRTGSERATAFTKTAQDFQLTKMGLENELLAAQIAKLRGPAVGPPMPDLVPAAKKYEDAPKQIQFGYPIPHYPGASNAEDAEKRYGDVAQEVFGLATLLQDMGYNIKRNPLAQTLLQNFNMAPSMYRESRQVRQR